MKNKIIEECINVLKDAVNVYRSNSCTFWACEGNYENNRIKTMVTCSRCSTIILTNRKIKKLEKLNS